MTTGKKNVIDWLKVASTHPGGKQFFWCGYLKRRLVVKVVWNRFLLGWNVEEADSESVLEQFQNDIAGKKYAETLQFGIR